MQKTLGRRFKRVIDMFCTPQELIAESDRRLELSDDTECDVE